MRSTQKRPSCGRLLLAIVATLACAACQGPVDTARQTFSQRHSCPLDRLEARERADVGAYPLVWGTGREPPPAVKADPGRLAVSPTRAERRQLVDSSVWGS